MKNFSTIFAMVLFVLSTHLFAKDKQDEIIATWETQEAQVDIYKLDDRYIGNPISSEGKRNIETQVLNLEYENDKWVGKTYSKKKRRALGCIMQCRLTSA